MESAETCKKDPDGIFFGLTAAIKTRIYMDAPSDSENRKYTIAHMKRFKPTCRPNHTIENPLGCLYIIRLYFIQNWARKSSSPNPYLRVLISAARPKKIPSGSFLHVSADASRSARRPLGARSVLIERTSCGLRHRAKGPPGRTCGQSWSSPVPPA